MTNLVVVAKIEMNILKENEFFEFVQQLLSDYEKLGPLPGILLPFVEAFLPFLPLFVFVLANAAAYGLFKGFFYSWLGASLGSLAVFLIIRQIGNSKLLLKIRMNKQVKRVTDWVEERGFGPLFILLCFPFSPSSVINIVAGLSRVNIYQFVLAVFLGKSVMIFSIAYVGTSVLEFAQKPLKTVVVSICIILFWIFGKYLEKRLLHRKGTSK